MSPFLAGGVVRDNILKESVQASETSGWNLLVDVVFGPATTFLTGHRC